MTNVPVHDVDYFFNVEVKNDWHSFWPKVACMRSSLGCVGYSVLGMIKSLIIQAWHSLNDRELEEALKVRLDFFYVTQLINVPDHTTICRFRNKRITLGLLEDLLQEINHQLEKRS